MASTANNLVIVESPAKARTIEKFLGTDYIVKSSFGHIRDLPKKGLNIDKTDNFTPTYEISPDKKKIVAELRKIAKTAKTVWIASDEDREGEAIAWHLCQALKLDPKTTKRIVFHEITKSAIENAIKNPRVVNSNLVDAQQARRILDRLVGYELSPVLWKKIRPGLSAGRVQSVAVRLIQEREDEINAFQSDKVIKIKASLSSSDKGVIEAELDKKLNKIDLAREILEKSKTANFVVSNISKKPGVKNPPPPFTTSSLQQEASSRAGFGVKQTMMLAQRLYESGTITYMRTDSTILSGQATHAIGEYIESKYGKKYHQYRQFKTKNASAQEAHEAIRPTNVSNINAGNDEQQRRLYKLIWNRAVSSQMSSAKIERTEVLIDISTAKNQLKGKGEILVFDGYLSVYGGSKEDKIIPNVKAGDKLELQEMVATEAFSRGPARYSEASLVRKLEEMGIGRPSTYAPTIGTIQTRGYIEKSDIDGQEKEIKILKLLDGNISETTDRVMFGADRNKLLPTHSAKVTTDFLVKNFFPIVDYDFTAYVEKEFDKIAEGKEKWQDAISTFYNDKFSPLIVTSANISREESTQARKIGVDPKSSKPLIARYGRFGPMLQIGEATDDDKPRFAPLPDGTTIDNVTFEQALEMFKLPRTVGIIKKAEVLANIGRFGPYVQYEGKYYSIKGYDPLTINLVDAKKIIEEIKEKRKPIKEFSKSDISILNGPYGAYIKQGKINARIPKGKKPEDLTEKECIELVKNAPKKKRFKRKITRRTKR